MYKKGALYMNLRVIPNISERYKALWVRGYDSLPKLIDYSNNPTLIITEHFKNANRPALLVMGTDYGHSASTFFKNLDDDIHIARDFNFTRGGGIVFGEGVYTIALHTPKFISNIGEIFLECLQDKGIDAVAKNNDVMVKIDGKYKKVFGAASIRWDNKQYTTTMLITVKAPIELLRRYLRTDNFKFEDKPAFDDISDVVGGLLDVGLDESIIDDFVVKIAEKYNYTIVPSELTPEEIIACKELYAQNPTTVKGVPIYD